MCELECFVTLLRDLKRWHIIIQYGLGQDRVKNMHLLKQLSIQMALPLSAASRSPEQH